MEEYWQLFWETGAPEHYLLYRQEREKRAALGEEQAAQV